MADFCKQCSDRLFGFDTRDLAGITSHKDWKQGRAAIVICEGCGAIQVDPEGGCISEDCLENGHELKGRALKSVRLEGRLDTPFLQPPPDL